MSEVFLHDKTNALSVQAGAREISVVCLIVDLEGEVAAGVQQIADVEVADERRCGLRGIVTIAKLSVDKQAVVEHTSIDDSLVLGIVPAFCACRYVGTEVPVVVLYQR